MPKSKTDLKPFRRSIAILKRQGLVTGVDARSVRPNPKLNRIVKKYDDVISGKATAVKLSPEGVKKRRSIGDQVVSPVSARTGKARKKADKLVIVPHDATEKVRVKNDEVITTRPVKGGGEITKRDVPIEYHNLEQYLEDLRDQPSDPNSWYCMKVYGDYTHCYRTIDLLIDEFTKYKSVMNAAASRPKDQLDFYKHLQIVTVKNPRAGEALRNAAINSRKHKRSKTSHAYNQSKYERRISKLKSGPKWKLDEYRRKQAARQSAYRSRHNK